MKKSVCKHCGKEIGLWFEREFDARWMHAPDDGPDAYEACDTVAEPVEEVIAQ
jgi:hypothetical protein